MPAEAGELYSNLNKLLSDICKFLKDETNYAKLSPAARKQADELIGRSKRQLQEITKIVNENNETDMSYVDMDRNKPPENNEDDDEEDIYTSVDEPNIIPNPAVITNHQAENPYENLPARELSQEIKYGPLSWKCRIILKFEKMRRIYAGVHDNWLLIYSNERDNKPLQTLNLKYHKAQNVLSKQGKNLEQDFELVSTSEEKKTYYFTALTHKDMLQWISHINRCHEYMNKIKNKIHQNPSIPEDDDEDLDQYVMIEEMKPQQKEEEEEEEAIYDQPVFHRMTTSVNRTNLITPNVNNKPPDLPARINIVKPKQPLPPTPPVLQEEELSESSTYDPVNYADNVSHDDNDNSSFSSDSEDSTYETFLPRT